LNSANAQLFYCFGDCGLYRFVSIEALSPRTVSTITEEKSQSVVNRIRGFGVGLREALVKPDNTLSLLKKELDFVSEGGYRNQYGWRPPLYFEDSEICPPTAYSRCSNDCVLTAFVPEASRFEAPPCRHIPLNEAGETLKQLYRTGTIEETEAAVREWLRSTIEKLELAAAREKTDTEAKAA
jgi:hypothetical protein